MTTRQLHETQPESRTPRLVPHWFPTGSQTPLVDPKMTGSPGSPPRRGNQSDPLVPKSEGTSHPNTTQNPTHHTTTTNPQETPMTTPTDGHPIDQGPTPQPHRPVHYADPLVGLRHHVAPGFGFLDAKGDWSEVTCQECHGTRTSPETPETVVAGVGEKTWPPLTAEEEEVDQLALLPAENMALTVGLAQTLRGEAPEGNVAAMCVLALARLTGRHDWTAEAEGGQS